MSECQQYLVSTVRSSGNKFWRYVVTGQTEDYYLPSMSCGLWAGEIEGSRDGRIVGAISAVFSALLQMHVRAKLGCGRVPTATA